MQSVYDAVYGSYYEYQTMEGMKDLSITVTIALGFILALLVVIIFTLCFNRNT